MNHLGWVNKNFYGREQSGDIYIHYVVQALKSIVQDHGLIFRLGGDEFLIVLDQTDPQKLKDIMTALQKNVRQFAKPLFKDEINRRMSDLNERKAQFDQKQITSELYKSYFQRMAKYIPYSEASISLGAALINGRSFKNTLKAAEEKSQIVKIESKRQLKLDISKYGELNEGPLNVLKSRRRSMPQVSDVDEKNPSSLELAELLKWSDDIKIQDLDYVKSIHLSSIEFRPGLRVVKATKQTGTESFVLSLDSDNQQALKNHRQLELYGGSKLFDLRTSAARYLVNQLISDSQSKASVKRIRIDLQNLGALNYFSEKSLTGDKALQICAEILSDVLTEILPEKTLGFKMNGSEFEIFINTEGSSLEINQMNHLLALIFNRLQNSQRLNQIYLDEIKVIHSSARLETEKNDQINRIKKLMEILVKVDEVESSTDKSRIAQ